MDLIKNLQMKYPKTIQIPFYLRLLAFVLFIVFLPGPLTAQDTHFSQFYANRIFLNPAFAGLEEGLTLTAITRTQWYTVDTGFKTVGISVEKRENVSDAFAFGIGLEAYSSDEGLSRYQQQSFSFTLAPMLATGLNSSLHAGFKLRYYRQRIDGNSLVFSDQLDPIFGNIYGTTGLPDFQGISFTDFDFGVLWRFAGNTKVSGRTASSVRGVIGASVRGGFQFLSNGGDVGPEYSFYRISNARLPSTLILHAGLDIPITFLEGPGRDITLSPNFRYETREDLNLFTGGLYFLYNGYYFGAFMQSQSFLPSNTLDTHSLILIVGSYIPTRKNGNQVTQKLFLGISGSFDATGLGTRAGGIWEAAVRYNFSAVPGFFSGKKRRNNSRIFKCKSFF